MHVFGYAAANPLRFTDPNGTCPGGDCGLAKQWAEDDSELARLCKVEHNEEACKLMKAEGVAAAGVVAAGVAVALAPAVPAVATQVAVSVGNAGGGAMVAEEATAAGLLAVAGKQCVEAPSLESCGTAVFLALTRRSPGAARGGKSSAAPSPGSGAQAAAVEEKAAVEARTAQVGAVQGPSARPVPAAPPASSSATEAPAANQAPSKPNGARFPNDPEKLFPEGYAGLEKTVRPDGKIDYEVQAGSSKYRVEYHPRHGGKPGDHFDGDHYHVKKEAEKPQPPKTKPNLRVTRDREHADRHIVNSRIAAS